VSALQTPEAQTLRPQAPGPPTATPRPLYLAGSGTPMFAVLHAPSGPPRQTAVLLCPPFGWEDMCCYRIRRDWAERLAGDGYTTLRIDLPGSGDSAGAPTDPGQLDAWTQAVDGAARWLRQPTGDAVASGGSGPAGAERVAVLGIGLGGLVACRAALRGAPIDELVLWAVPARGRTLVRELRSFAALEVANVLQPGESAPPSDPADEGTLVANGYLLSAATVAELQRLDLREVRPSAPTLSRALLLGRDGLKVHSALSEVLERAGAEVTVADGPGYGAMMVEPQDARTPIEVFERVGSWLEGGESRGAASLTPRAEQEEPVAPEPVVTDPLEEPSAPAPAVSCELTAHEEMVLHCSGVALRERPVFLDGPNGQRLFAVLTEPLDGHRELSALLVNAGPQRRTGPNRMWVEIARRWAARGVATLRLDAAGIGDSDGDASVLARNAEFYKPEYVAQTRAALETMAARGLPPRFLALGLCGGAYWSAHAALADERVAAVVMLNPRTLVFDEWRHTVRRTRLLKAKLTRAATWRKVLRGEIKLARHIELGRTLLGRARSAPARVYGRIAAPRRGDGAARQPGTRQPDAREPGASGPIEDLFDQLRDRDQRGLLLFTGKEVLRGELTENGVLEKMERWPNLELALRGTSADTHTLTPLWLQRQVHALVDRVLEDELQRLPEAAHVLPEASNPLPEASHVLPEASHV
jgi:alpha-beta hydrolase superfamily lysophospholipase